MKAEDIQSFGDELRVMLAPSWALVGEPSKRGEELEITVISEAAELYALPLELLTEKTEGTPLGMRPAARGE